MSANELGPESGLGLALTQVNLLKGSFWASHKLLM
jgi:hypothetical protein